MPLDMDFEFGKRAVSAGRLKQDQLEECVEILVALERVGSKQRLWQVVQRKAYMTEAAIAEIRATVEAAAPSTQAATPPVAPKIAVAPKPSPAPKSPVAPKLPAAPKSAAGAEETADDLHLPLRHARGFALAHVHKGGQTKLYPLPPRVVTIGKAANCDIVLSDPGVLDQHARLNFRQDTYAVEEAAPGRGIVVNDQRVRARKLAPYDLMELGSALLLFLPDYGDQPAVEPVDQVAAGAGGGQAGAIGGQAGGGVHARVRITEGARNGLQFFLGSSPLVIGRHTLANARLREPAVAEFHAQIARTPQGTRLVDLLSAPGTKVNGVRVSRQLLNEGDNISIGPVTLAFSVVVPAAAGKDDRPTEPVLGGKSAAVPGPRAEGDFDWDIAAEVEVEPPADPFLRRGTKVLNEDSIARAALKVFKPGELRLMCVEGPLEGKRFVIARSSMVIGRDAGLDLTIPDGSVSRRHAEIVLGPKKAEVKDLGSRNGIFVNGARVAVAAIRPGDTLRVHKSLFLVEEIPPRPQARKP